jgi:beta-lactamase class A
MKRLLASMILLTSGLPVLAAGVTGLPVNIEEAGRPQGDASVDFWSSMDGKLQAGLEEILQKHGLTEAARSGRLAVALADITDPGAPRVATVNGDRMMYAASLPKIAILLGAMDKMQRERIAPDDSLSDDIVQMIRYSSNAAATRVLQWVGRDPLIQLLQSQRLKLYDPAHNGGLWVGKDYGGNPAYRRDPLHNLSHGATAMQVTRLFYLLESGQLLDPSRTALMKSALSEPGIRHKFVKGLEQRPEATIYRKSGTWRQFHADGALVESGGRKLVLVGLADDARGGEWLASIAAPLHDLVVKGQKPAAGESVARHVAP